MCGGGWMGVWVASRWPISVSNETLDMFVLKCFKSVARCRRWCFVENFRFAIQSKKNKVQCLGSLRYSYLFSNNKSYYGYCQNRLVFCKIVWMHLYDCNVISGDVTVMMSRTL